MELTDDWYNQNEAVAPNQREDSSTIHSSFCFIRMVNRVDVVLKEQDNYRGKWTEIIPFCNGFPSVHTSLLHRGSQNFTRCMWLTDKRQPMHWRKFVNSILAYIQSSAKNYKLARNFAWVANLSCLKIYRTFSVSKLIVWRICIHWCQSQLALVKTLRSWNLLLGQDQHQPYTI